VLQQGPGFEVREIVVAPGARLALQGHEERAEHWVVVGGTAQVTLNDDVTILEQSQTMAVPSGARGRIENPGQVPARIIQVQCGERAGERDITLGEIHPRR
jgi:mannose-1-phosphate guanylyltransferase/mannose-6-phosphate isomerase